MRSFPAAGVVLLAVLMLACSHAQVRQSVPVANTATVASAPQQTPTVAPTAAPTPSPVPTATPTPQTLYPALTREALRNAEYQFNQERVRLSDGLLKRKVSWSDYVRESWQLREPIAFGDLNDDGAEDAAVVLSYNGGGSGTFYNVLAVLNENGAPVHVASISIGDRIRLNALEVAAGVITVKMVAHGPNDAACCPTIDTVATFRLNGNTLELLSEAPPGDLTASAQRQARPTVVPARIDPGFAGAFQEMRNAYTEEIDALYDWFVDSGARARFGPLGESISQFNSTSNLITINEKYRNESPTALAHALLWPLASLHAIDERDGPPRSWDECIADRLAAHSAQALWWHGNYYAYGEQDPTQLEQWANTNLASYRDKSLGAWVREAYRESCASYGEPPPAPTPTPRPAQIRTGCDVGFVEHRIIRALGGKSNVGYALVQGMIRRSGIPSIIDLAIYVEKVYTAWNLPYPNNGDRSPRISLDFCEWVVLDGDYRQAVLDAIWPDLNDEGRDYINRLLIRAMTSTIDWGN